MKDMFDKEIVDGANLIRPIVSVGGSILGTFKYEVRNGRAVLVDNDGLGYIYDNGDTFALDADFCKSVAVEDEREKA